MNELEFIKECEACACNDSIVSEIETAYSVKLPLEIKKYFSFVPNDYFFGEWRLLATDEIVAQSQWMIHDMTKKRIIPFIDKGDLDYISYVVDEGKWAIVHDGDGIVYRKVDQLIEYLNG